ncbi:hypothetical protein ACJMK2_003076 [Sinanodonta woodiana]|uniref:Vertnin n=1 Tax=Sinanodonta woodiana TaxID=1069815 RepID=A0ABD3Y0P4_SINWO
MIEQKQKKIPSKLKTVPGTQKIHQIVYEAQCPGVIYVRDISYRCRFKDPHEQHELTEVNFPKKDFPKRDYPKKDIPKKDFQKRDFPKKDFLKREEENQHTLSEAREEENQQTLSEPIKPPNREKFFEDCLKSFEECTTFKDLKKNCLDISRKIIIWPVDYDRLTTIVNSGLNVDQQTMDIYPDDVQQTYVTFPVSVKADGNCLPYSGSVLAFGNDRYATEIRARIILEQTLYEEYYLQENYLKNGLDDPPKFDIKKAFAMYSDEYKHGTDRLNDKTTLQDIYEREVMKIRKRSTYMGIWQIFALSSVLQQKVFSIYPKLGNVNVRNDLHKIIHPRVNVCENRILYIMWTSTRSDMTRGHWLPNQPVLLIDVTVESKDQANEQQNEFENHEIEMETNVTRENYEMAINVTSENNELTKDEKGENNEMATNVTSVNNEMAKYEKGENNEMATYETGENNEMATKATGENNEMVTDERG